MNNLPNVNLKELKADLARNRAERLAFIDWYVAWQQRTPNKVWSKAQKKLIDKK